MGRTSTHAFGLALDVNIAGQLDNFADGRTQLGLILIADYFHEEGWVWGAGFRREDSMHFEVSRQQLEEWRAEGLI
ncbi:M15 family metallopeptidase [Mangrovicoccus ximenensis]|uniref:M15 family metallopeptidase n=1 Tax=Mangrovicoccus ximenensis TaxID=1911570 RepID=UPI002ECFD79D